jgi:cellulose synthase/poly-beta-1,6-N-acetylglucosamine synthase-like glycosyltransferase
VRPVESCFAGARFRCRDVLYGALALAVHLAIILFIIERRQASGLCAFVFALFVLTTASGLLRFLVFLALVVRRRHRRWLAPLGSGEWPSVTVLVPCHNEEAVIATTLTSLLQLSYPRFEVVVIDDGSTDATAAIAAGFGPRVRLIRQAKAGKAAALNRGIASLHSDLALLVDADCVFPRHTLKLAVRYLVQQGDDAIGGHLSVANGTTLLGQLQNLEYGGILVQRFFTRYSLNLQRTQDVIPGALGLFRTAALRRAGPLSTGLLAEDVDLTARLVQQGCFLAYCPYLVCATVVPETLGSLRIQRRRWVQGYLQVVLQQLLHWPSLTARARFAALAMAQKALAWPSMFLLSLAYIAANVAAGHPAILWLSLVAMPFPLSVQGWVRFRQVRLRTLLLFAYGYSQVIVVWKLMHQLRLLVDPRPTWQPYRRLRSAPGP